MKKFLFAAAVILSLSLLISCAHSCQYWRQSPLYVYTPPELGSKFIVTMRSDCRIYITETELAPKYEVLFEDIQYSLASNPKNEIVFIACEDPLFSTSEGLSVGDPLSDVRLHSRDAIVFEENFAFFVSLPSGWYAAFVPRNMSDYEDLPADATISFFFKRLAKGMNEKGEGIKKTQDEQEK